MKTTNTIIRRFGNSAGIILKEKVLFAMGLEIGDTLDIVCDGTTIILKKSN